MNQNEQKEPMRFRYVYMGIGSVLVILLALLTDPDSGFIQNLSVGVGIIATIAVLSKVVLHVAVLHLSRKALADYIDLEEYFLEARKSPQGAGLALIAVAIMMLSISIIIYAVVK